MLIIPLTRHAASRMAQRGIRPADVQSVFENGTPVNDNVILMRRQDADDDPGLQPTVGIVVVVEDGKVITVYRVTQRHEKRCLKQIRG